MCRRLALRKGAHNRGQQCLQLGLLANGGIATTAYLASMTSTRRDGTNRARLCPHSLKLERSHGSTHIIATSTMACTTLSMTADCSRGDGHVLIVTPSTPAAPATSGRVLALR